MSVPAGDLEATDTCPTTPVAPRALAWLAAVAVVLHVAWSLGPTLLRDDLFEGDAAQHTWWMYRFADPGLFPNDPAADYIAQPVFVPMGYQLLFRALVPVIDPQHLAESLAILLSLACGYIAWKFGRRIGCTSGGVAAVVAFCAFDMPGNFIAGGFPRSFGLPMLMLGTLAVLDRKWWIVGLLFLLGALLYTPLVMNLAPLAGVMFLVSLWRARKGDPLEARTKQPANVVLLFALGLIALGVIVAFTLRPLPEWVGPFFTVDQMRSMPEWNKGGRMMLFRPWQIMYFGLSTSGIGIHIAHVPVVVGLLVLTVILFRRAIPLTAWVLLATALTVWALAHVFLFKLYMPSRYMIYAKPVFAVMWAAGLGRELWAWFERRGTPAAAAPAVGRLSVVAASLMIAAASAIVWGPGFVTQMSAPSTWDPPPGLADALERIETMPRDTLVAAHPLDANLVPIRARRSVLVNSEMSVAMNTAYYADQKQRLESAFDLFYASDFDSVMRIAQRWGVDVVLVNQQRLRSPAADYFEPFPARIEGLIQGAKGSFALLDPPAERVLLRVGDVLLVDVSAERP